MEKIKNIKLPNGEVYELGGSGGGGLPMLTSIWTDHLLNDASYLRADTFSWHSADIYITGYNIIEAEYDDENCIEETENGVIYRRSPNGFKIADASQHDNVLSAYNSTGIAWFYIIDKANRRFKLPRTKYGFTGLRDKAGNNVEAGLPNITGTINDVRGSAGGDTNSSGAIYWTGSSDTWRNDVTEANSGGAGISINASRSNLIYGNSNTVQPPATQMYLYFYIGEYERPKAEINLGVLTELANGLDLNVIIDEITTVKNTGLEEITTASTLGLTDITEASSTGLANVNDAVGEGLTSIQTLAGSSISEIIETTDAGKAELQKIIVDKVPVATVDNVGLVKPDGDTIVIENGVIRADIEVPEVALATTSTAGIVKPDGTTITIADGVISAVGGNDDSITLVQSYVNGTTGYNIYSNKYCEQWGQVTTVSGSSATVTFPKPFANTNYSLQATCITFTISQSAISEGAAVGTKKNSGSTFSVCTYEMTGYGHFLNAKPVSWKACGYIS